MTINNTTITKGFLLAGAMNMSVLIFSRFFTNSAFAQFDPDVMSNFGLLMIVVWGLAYISVAKRFQHLRWLVGVFAVEKLIYSVNWIVWVSNNSISEVYQEDTMAGLFYSIYGVNDLLFFLFFLGVFVSIGRGKPLS